MYFNLNTGAIGIREHGLERALALAQATGFGGVDFSITEAAHLAQERGINWLRELFAHHDAQPGTWGLPVNWQADTWEQDLERLPALAACAREIGALRTTTWCPPSSPTRAFAANFEWHRLRFTRIAETLLPYGIRVGFEFIGPKSFPPPGDHLFIDDMPGMLRLIEAVGTGNAGLLLDAWHVFTSGGQMEDIRGLTNELVVAVHVNDAPRGLTMATYDDHDRRLPTESGVIDLGAFLRELRAIGYDGPVTCEPFSARVNAIGEPLAAAQLVAEHMRRMWTAAGFP